MACGTGKTLVARFLHSEVGSHRTLVLVPSLSLLKQTLREWLAVGPVEWLVVCSDDTVRPEETDAITGSTSELGFPVTTDPQAIAGFLRKRGERVVFATYQSSPQIAAAQSSRTPAFDLVIADEAHRCTGPQAGVFATVLDAKKIKARKRLFMTATPRYFTGRVKHEAKEADWEVASMDEEEKFGSVLHRLSFAQAIDKELLSDYQVVVVGVSDREAHTLAARGAFVSRDGEHVTDARTLAREIGLLRSIAKYDLDRVVTFHSRIHLASRFASSLPETKAWLPRHRRPTGTLWTDHVSGKMTAGERETRLQRLKAVQDGERGVLTNARCLNEGVDVPTLDGVAFIDPRRSQVDVVQAVGRAIRKTEDKTVGTIVIPVLVGEDVDPEVALTSSEFKRVWEVVKALRSHDEDLAEELDALRRGQGQRGSVGALPAKIVLDLPSNIGADFALAFDTKVVEVSTSGWEYGLGAARAYWEEHGHLRVPLDHVDEKGFPLGSWLTVRRTQWRNGRIRPERVAQLDALGMVWSPQDAKFERALDECRHYREVEGDLLVPLEFVTSTGFNLGAWVNTQRIERRRGTLSASRIAALDELGMLWEPASARWQRGVDEARRFSERHGHARPSRSYVTEEGFPLGTWIDSRRAEYRRGKLSSERVTLLAALPGWSWDPKAEAEQHPLQALSSFVSREGHAGVPAEHVEDGFRLGMWVASRRTDYRSRRLDEELTKRLEALPGWTWDPFGDAWERGFRVLRGFVDREGHARVRHDCVEDGFRLGEWRQRQRQAMSKGTLSPARVARLEALPGWAWDTRKKATV
jgi:superfamily II DNA or RNA helicase